MATYYRWRKSTVKYSLKELGRSQDWVETGYYPLYDDDVYEVLYCPLENLTITKNSIILNSPKKSLGGGYSSSPFHAPGYSICREYEGSTPGTYSTSHVYKATQGNAAYSLTGENRVTVREPNNYPSALVVKYGPGNASPDTFVEYVYNTSSSAYPNSGMSGNYYYDQRTTVTSPTAPSGISYPATITTPSITVSWTAATSNTDYPVNGYQVDVSTNGGSSWTSAGTPTRNSLTYPITPGTTSIRFRVRAKDSNGQWGDYATGADSQVLLAPTLTVPQMVMQGQSATISWSAIEGADSYTLQRKSSTDTNWTQVYSGPNTTFSETVGTWTTVQYRVQAVFSGTPGGWAESAAIPVVSASSLVISGTNEDLGVVTNDIPYSISTDTGNQITATITVNNAVIFSGNVGNSTADVIPVLDLITGEGTIVISATVDASGSPVTATRTWTYEKAAITFPNSGSVAQITKEGENIYPKVLAEGVRLPGGKTLDQVMGFPAQIYTGSYVGTGTSGASNPNTLTFPFEPKVVYIYGQGAGINLIGSWGWTRGVQEGIVLVQNELMKPGITISWADKSVSWYQSGTAEEAAYQMNSPGVTYLYVALG